MARGIIEFLGALLMTWPIHAVPAIVLALPSYLLTRRSFAWRWSDLLGLVIPWLVWFGVFAFGRRPASLSSALVESLLLGCGVGVGYFLLATIGKQGPLPGLRRWMLGIVCAFAVALWAFFPFLNE